MFENAALSKDDKVAFFYKSMKKIVRKEQE